MNTLALSVVTVPTDKMLSIASASFFFSAYFGFAEIGSQVIRIFLAFSC